MLEDWSGVRLTYKGSFICLWNPVHATADWAYGAPVYKPPARDWSFDADFNDPALLPPLTPMIYNVRFTGWERH